MRNIIELLSDAFKNKKERVAMAITGVEKQISKIVGPTSLGDAMNYFDEDGMLNRWVDSIAKNTEVTLEDSVTNLQKTKMQKLIIAIRAVR
jgi:hypothetical protein